MNWLQVVLVRSKYPRNIGQVSRIMANFAVQRLILISPQCELNFEAKQGAAQGQEALGNATIYSDWSEFYQNETDGLRIAFSRRQGRRRVSQALPQFLSEAQFEEQRPVFLIFGAEDHGLSTEDLDMVHKMVYFDLPGEVQSMNLSHSVLMALHSFYQRFGEFKALPLKETSIKNPEPFLRQWLESMSFDLDTHPHWNALTMLKQLILRAAPSEEELHKLEMIIQQSIRKIKDRSQT